VGSAKRDFEAAGVATISGQGQVTLPKSAREATGLMEGRVLVFIERERGEILITHEPLADEMIELAAAAAKKRGASS
jgi:AbrB family looped-hinge helix DNA binding protein